MRNFVRGHPVGVFLFVLSLLFTFTRLLFLDQTFMLHDERDIVFSGLSLARTGRDLFGNVFPIRFEGINPHNPLFSIWFSAFSWIFIPIQSVTFARLPFVLAGSSLPFLFFHLSKTITKDVRFSVIFAVLATGSPWMFHLSRYAMDIATALPIMLLAIILLLKENRFLAYLLLFVSCFNYQGFRVAIPFILVSCEAMVQVANSKQSIRPYVMHGLFIATLFISVFLIDKNITLGRTDQVAFLNMEKFASVVDDKRIRTLAPLEISRIFDNKLTESYKYALEGFFEGLNPSIFFFRGDNSATNGTGVGGLLFLTYFPLFVYGITQLRHTKKQFLFLVCFLFVGMTPAIASLHGHSYGIRGSLMIVGFTALITIGLNTLILHPSKNTIWKKGLYMLLSISLLIEVVVFSYDYFARRPILLGEMYVERERTLMTYLKKLPPTQRVYVFDIEPKNLLMSYLFLENIPFSEVHRRMQETKKGKYSVRHITFTDCNTQWNTALLKAQVLLASRCLSDVENKRLSLVKSPRLMMVDTPATAFYIHKQISGK